MSKRPTKVILGTLALLGFLSVTIFWWAGIHTGDSHVCVTATLQNGICPNATSAEAAAFHQQALQSFAVAPFEATPWIGLLFAALFVAATVRALRTADQGPSAPVKQENAVSVIPPKRQYRWLSLLEHSPSLVFGRA